MPPQTANDQLPSASELPTPSQSVGSTVPIDPLYMPTGQVQPDLTAPGIVAPQPSTNAPLARIDSYNSSSIKHSRQAVKISNLFITLCMLLVLGAVFVLWYLAGRPTSFEDLPFLDRIIKS